MFWLLSHSYEANIIIIIIQNYKCNCSYIAHFFRYSPFNCKNIIL